MTVDPETPSIINGDVMFLHEPCLSVAIENITCIFTDNEGDVTEFTDRTGKVHKKLIRGISKNRSAICPMPLFRTLGEHNYKLTVIVRDGSNYSGSFEVGEFSVCTYISSHVQPYMYVSV